MRRLLECKVEVEDTPTLSGKRRTIMVFGDERCEQLLEEGKLGIKEKMEDFSEED